MDVTAKTSARHRTRNPRGEGDRLRADLVTAASRLLKDLPGQESLSMRAVARAAGVSAPSVYLHFADKSELMLAVLAQRFAEFGAELEAASSGIADPKDQLRARCHAYAEFAARHPGHYAVMFTAIPETGPAAEADLPGAGIVADIARLVAACAPAVDPRETALLIWAGLHGIVSLRVSKPRIHWPPATVLIDALLDRLVPVTP